jgi:hypothetical protein
MVLGYARPLKATDLYKLPPDRGAAHISELITESFLRRVQNAEEYNTRLARGEIGPGIKGVWWSITRKREAKEREWRERTGKKKGSLVWAMNDSVKWWFWSGGLLKVVGDTLQVTSTLVVKVGWLSSLKPLAHHLFSQGNHQICDRLLCWASNRTKCATYCPRHRPHLCPPCHASYCVALWPPLFLSKHLEWCFASRRPHKRYI